MKYEYVVVDCRKDIKNCNNFIMLNGYVVTTDTLVILIFLTENYFSFCIPHAAKFTTSPFIYNQRPVTKK